MVHLLRKGLGLHVAQAVVGLCLSQSWQVDVQDDWGVPEGGVSMFAEVGVDWRDRRELTIVESIVANFSEFGIDVAVSTARGFSVAVCAVGCAVGVLAAVQISVVADFGAGESQSLAS